MSKTWIGCSCRLFPSGKGSEKEGSSERWFAGSLQNGDQLWPQDPHNIELICRDGQDLRGHYEVSCLLPFHIALSQEVAPEEVICTKYFLRHRKNAPREDSSCLEIRVLGYYTTCQKNEYTSLDSRSVLADQITSQWFRA